ncbi:putative LRR receptor-like protein kinase At1g51890 [Carex rostrata]
MASFRKIVLWRLIFLLISTVSVQVHSQPDSNGFLSIDCGLSETSSYVEEDNKLNYVSDEKFIDTGVNSNISSDIISKDGKNYLKEYLTVRYFPDGIRNCYTLRSLTVGSNYLIRGTFFYGNYDNKNNPPTFDIYLGVNFWNTVNATTISFPEIIVAANASFLEVCLVNTKKGAPFISSLHLRQLTNLYPYVNSTTSLIFVRRDNFGASDFIVRYPDDKYDRWWLNNTYDSTWSAISTNASIDYVDLDFGTPSRVFQTAAATTSTNQPFVIYWSSKDTTIKYYYILHFYETQDTSKTGSRDFYISERGNQLWDSPYPGSRKGGWVAGPTTGFTYYNVSLKATANSTLPPAMNAFELYTVASVGATTYAQDVAAINSIKDYYGIKKGWSGDPCLPREFIWTGINCTSSSSSITRITSLNLSSSSLTGPLNYSFGYLTALEYLDITGDKNISTALPPELLKRKENGMLDYRYSPSLSPPPPPPPPPKNFIILIVVAVLVLVIAVAIAVILRLKRRKYNRIIAPKPTESFESNLPQSSNLNEKPQSRGGEQILPDFGNRKFSYDDLKKITNDFKNNIGTGGYGSVYLGLLENGVQVAVKMLSQSSSQGLKEFLAEAENLTRVHHKNLVSLMGYCIDKNSMSLVYEYMQGGNLHDKLKDNVRPLDWKLRLRIAYESALGLEYLHKACNPPLIHRDVKTSNILLNANLEAKIADFGLSRAFNNDGSSHVSTRIVGTPGYLDPEYYLSNQLSVKSDVFSFGVVLLEIITGRPPITMGLEGGSLIQWVSQKLSGGDIKSIVDPKMQSKYDINSAWKVTELACSCTEPTSSKRPTMAGVVAELKESMDLQISTEEIHMKSTENFVSDVSQDSNFEMAYMGGMPAPGPSVR